MATKNYWTQTKLAMTKKAKHRKTITITMSDADYTKLKKNGSVIGYGMNDVVSTLRGGVRCSDRHVKVERSCLVGDAIYAGHGSAKVKVVGVTFRNPIRAEVILGKITPGDIRFPMEAWIPKDETVKKGGAK